ncbi:hypothetical protein [Kangiella sp. M94]
MKKIVAIILALFGLGAQEASANQSVIDGMRTMALNLKAEEIGLTPENFPNEVFGLLMETGFENGSFTLLVLADGTTSLYFSNGGGIIGAGTHENVKKASSILLSGANHFRPQTKLASAFPYPSNGEVKFYFIGRSGVTSYSAKEVDLGENRDPLSKLFHISHMVISELRQIEESGHNQ